MKTLANELKILIDGYDDNPAISSAQRAIWRKVGRNASIRQALLCNEGEGCLRLLEGDGGPGFDGEPVVDIPRGRSRKIFEYGTVHTFPTDEDLDRICAFFAQDFYPSANFLLKGCFEQHCASEAGFKQGGHECMRDILCPVNNSQQFAAFQWSFKPDIAKLYTLPWLNEKAQAQGYETLEQFEGLVEHMMASNIYLLSIADSDFQAFVAEEQERQRLVQEGTAEERGRYWFLKREWLSLLRKTDAMAEQVESERLKHAEVQRQWLSLFGSLELELEELNCRRSYLERAILLKKARPGAAETDITEQLAEQEREQSRKISELRRQVTMAPLLDKSSMEGTTVSPGQLDEEQEACKRLMRKIRMLLHTDRLETDPAYQKLGEAERQQLHEMLLEAVSIKPYELGIPKKFARYDMRTQQGLRHVLRQIESILQLSEVDITVSADIKGDSLQDKLRWLSSEISILTSILLNDDARLQSFAEDEENQRKQSVIENESVHERIRADYTTQIEETRKTIACLLEEYRGLFSNAEDL